MAYKHKFSNKEEEKIIQFVKKNKFILKNGKHRSQVAEKDRLWNTLANDMNIDGEY